MKGVEKMNIENLECFLLVAENLSFARAARAMHISQPAVTKQIRTLEHELGISLFERSTRHVRLTPGGEAFYEDAKEIVLKTQMAVSRAKRQGDEAEILHIGVSNPSALFYLQKILKEFRKGCPEARPDIECLDYKHILNLFLDNKLDLLLYYKENLPKEYDAGYVELKKDRLCCLVPKEDPLSRKSSVKLEELKEQDMIACSPLDTPLSIAAVQEKLLESHPPQKVRYCSSIEAAHCLAGAGFGVVLLPGMLCLKSPDFVSLPVEEGPEFSFGVFYREKKMNSHLNKLIKMLTKEQLL